MNRSYNIVLSLFVFLVFLIFNNFEIQTSITSLLPTKQSQSLYETSLKFDNSNILVLYSNSYKKTKDAKEALLTLENVDEKVLSFENQEYLEYLKKYRYYIYGFNQDGVDVNTALKQQYQKLLNSSFHTIDSLDPLNLFIPPSVKKVELLDGSIAKVKQKYFSFLQLKNSELKPLYDKIQTLEGVTVFSPQFYFYENPKKIQNQVNYIMAVGIFILLVLFLYIIKDFNLFINTFSTLIASALFSLLVLGFFFDGVSIFVIVFGIIICAVGIDYMFHNYLNGYYQKKRYNKEVFFGFITTFAALLILSSNEYSLIRQISLFSSFSLLYSYLVFTFIYPLLGFDVKQIPSNLKLNAIYNLSYKPLTLFLSIFIALLFWQVEFNTKIAQLDYDNVKLKKIDNEIASYLQKKDITSYLIKANSLQELLNRSKNLANEGVSTGLEYFVTQKSFQEKEKLFNSKVFKMLHSSVNTNANELGFKKGYFQNAYSQNAYTKDYEALDLAKLRDFGFDIIKQKDKYIFLFKHQILDQNIIKKFNLIAVNFDLLFKKGFEKIYESLVIQAVFAGLFVVMFLYFVSHNYFKSVIYILLPLFMILLYSFFFTMNIMMAIATFAMLAIAVDYGIYMANTPQNSTKKAIIYSLVTTFAGFGVLIFSFVDAIHSLGVVAVLGIVSILFLIFSA